MTDHPTPTSHGGQFVNGQLVHETDNRGIPGAALPAAPAAPVSPAPDPEEEEE